jgi:hypothetical protein
MRIASAYDALVSMMDSTASEGSSMRNKLLGGTAVGIMAAAFGLTAPGAFASPLGSSSCAQTTSAQITCDYTASSTGNFASQALPIDLFDSHLGALQGVVVSESLHIAANRSNGSFAWGAAQPITSTTTVNESVSAALAISNGPQALNGSPALTVTAFQSPALAIQSGSSGVLPFSGIGTAGLLPDPGPLSDWESANPLTDTLLLVSSLSGSLTGGGITTSQLTFPNGGPDLTLWLTIVYDYSPTFMVAPAAIDAPEPATLLTLGIGLIGIAAARKKHGKRS